MILNQPSLISAFLFPPWLKSIKAEQESWGESWTTGTRAQNKNLFLIILKSCIPGQNCSIGVEIQMWKIKFTALLILQFPPLLSLTKPYNTQCGSKQSGALPNDLVPLFLVYFLFIVVEVVGFVWEMYLCHPSRCEVRIIGEIRLGCCN